MLFHLNGVVSPGELANITCHGVEVRPRDVSDAAGHEESCQAPSVPKQGAWGEVDLGNRLTSYFK